MATTSAPLGRFPAPEQVDELVALLRSGSHLLTACEYTGIPERSVYNWIREGRSDNPRPWVDDFYRRISEARAHAQVANLQVIQRAAANGTWQAAAWYLERSQPHLWGLKQRHEINLTATNSPITARDKLNSALDALGQEIANDIAEVIELPAANAG